MPRLFPCANCFILTTMKLHAEAIEGIRQFLDSIQLRTLLRGRSYFGRGAVVELECIAPDHLYSAVVCGGRDYAVGLEFANGGWAAECSCPAGMDCKHIVAALLALQQLASANGGIGVAER